MIMKKIFIILMAASIAFATSCKKDQKVTVSSNIAAPELTSPSTGTAVVVTSANTGQAININWKKANYGVDAVVTYFIQVDSAGRSFAKKINIGSTTKDSLSITFGDLNNALLGSLNLPANAASTIELRTGSAIYGKDSVFSKPVTLNVTTFKELAPPILYLPGSYEGYNPGAAPTIPSVTTFTYEGYAYFNAPGNFKFTSAPDYSHVNYGDGGSGKLTTDGAANGIGYNDAGYYKLNADIKNLTFSYLWIKSFGIIGTATPHSWDASTPMTFDVAKGTWSIKVDLVAGALKFRANDAWDLNYGPADSNALSGFLVDNDPGAISIPADGNYTVTIDMSQSTQKKYLYTIVKN
jgi:hypothetical protein